MKTHQNTSKNRFNTHLRKLREKKAVTASAIAEQLGIHRNTQLNYELDRDPKIEYLMAFCDKLNTSFHQLISHRVMYSDCPQELIDKTLDSLSPFSLNEGFTQEPKAKYQIDKRLNSIQLNDKVGGPIIGILEQIARSYQNHPNIRVFKQHGQSMAPKICENDLIVVDTNDNKIVDGDIYYLNFNNQMMARRIQISLDGRLILSCENEQFTPIITEKDHIDNMTIIGKMICYIGNCH